MGPKNKGCAKCAKCVKCMKNKKNAHLDGRRRVWGLTRTKVGIILHKSMVMAILMSFFEAPIAVADAMPTKTLNIADVYQYITSENAKGRTIKLRQIQDEEAAKKFKREQFDYVTPSGIFQVKKNAGLSEHSGIICLDFDHVENISDFKSRIFSDKVLHPLLVFTSPSGDGIKVFVPVNLCSANHETCFKGLSSYVYKVYRILPDQKCKDVSRACFLPFDSDAKIRIGKNVEPFDPQPYLPIEKSIRTRTDNSTSQRVESVLQRIDERCLDITSDYHDWINVAFALASEFGEAGREYYHRVSQYYPKYTREGTDRQYTACLRNNGTGITIGTFFFLAEKNGIHFRNDFQSHAVSKEQGCMSEGDDKLPTFSDKILDDLPEFLKSGISMARTHKEADVILMGMLAFCSSTLPHIYGMYDYHIYFPNLYVLIDGPAGSGKERMSVAKYLGSNLHQSLINTYEKEQLDYIVAHREWELNGNADEEPKAPSRKLFFIPGNVTKASFISQLEKNGGEGFVTESEIDTLVNSNASQFGKFSDILRQSWGHETISSLVNSDNNRYVYIPEPRLSLCLSGTPDQTRVLIGNVENGLFSRFVFYHLPMDLTWRDPFLEEKKEASIRARFTEMGENYVEKYYQRLFHHEDVQFTLTPIQREEFNSVFSMLKTNTFQEAGEDMIASVNRLGVLQFRIAMILTALNAIDDGSIDSASIKCSEAAFRASLKISKVLLEHTKYIMRCLPETVGQMAFGKAFKLLEELPDRFDRRMYHSASMALGINVRTADRYMRELTNFGKLERVDFGVYQKV